MPDTWHDAMAQLDAKMLLKAINRYQRTILQTRCQHVEGVIACIFWEQTVLQNMRKTNRDFCLDVVLLHSAVVLTVRKRVLIPRSFQNQPFDLQAHPKSQRVICLINMRQPKRLK